MTKIVCISDTHMFEPELPKGDVLIHAGDMTYKGQPHEIEKQLEWLAKNRCKYDHVIAVPGNHDFGFESDYSKYKKIAEDKGLILLNEQEIVLDSIKYFGSPITPFFHNWAFNRHPQDIDVHWMVIPDDTNVLITHGPPFNILDGVPEYVKTRIGYDQHYRPMYSKQLLNMRHVGCPELLERIQQLKQLKLHVFGHIHEGYGQEYHSGVKFVNPSIMDGDYQPVNKPIIMEI